MKLKLWNGNGWTCRGDYLYICAKNRRHAAILFEEARNKYYNSTKEISKFDLDRTYRHLTVYFNEGSWGNSMEDIKPEIGVWYSQNDREKPQRII